MTLSHSLIPVVNVHTFKNIIKDTPCLSNNSALRGLWQIFNRQLLLFGVPLQETLNYFRDIGCNEFHLMVLQSPRLSVGSLLFGKSFFVSGHNYLWSCVFFAIFRSSSICSRVFFGSVNYFVRFVLGEGHGAIQINLQAYERAMEYFL